MSNSDSSYPNHEVDPMPAKDIAAGSAIDSSGLHSPIPHRDQVSQLSPNALVAMLIGMFTIPVVTVLTLWFYLPPVSVHKLDATVELVGMETAADFDRRDKQSEVAEPKVIVKNIGDQQWTHLIVEVNKRFKVYRTEEVVDPGNSIEFGLDYFMSREGLFFPPGKIAVKHVRVYARLPTRARATYEIDIN